MAQDASEPGDDTIIVTGPGSVVPSKAHEYYEPIIGEWDMRWKLHNQAGEVTREIEGTTTNEWIVGGRWVQSSTGPDRAQEYGVVTAEATEPGGDARQIESLTVSWMARERLLDTIVGLQQGTVGVDMGPVELRYLPPEDHGTCHLCG